MSIAEKMLSEYTAVMAEAVKSVIDMANQLMPQLRNHQGAGMLSTKDGTGKAVVAQFADGSVMVAMPTFYTDERDALAAIGYDRDMTLEEIYAHARG